MIYAIVPYCEVITFGADYNMLTFFWCLYTLSLLIMVWGQVRQINLSFSLPFIILDLVHCFALYGILDHRHTLLRITWIWLHQVLFLIWITWRHKSLNQAQPSMKLSRFLFQWGYVGGTLVFLYITSPW